MVQVVCANMPRAGHHLLERMLRLALGKDYRYCEYHQALACCRQIPCSTHAEFAAQAGRVFMQKNHDFRMDSPRELDGDVRYLVQFRHPLPRLFSFFELRVRAGAVTATAEDLELFMAKEAAYHVLFVDKWTSVPRSGDILVKYEDLVADAGTMLASIVAGLGVAVAPAVIDDTVAECLSYRDLRGTRHQDRDVSGHPLYDPQRLEAYERFIFSRSGEDLYRPQTATGHHDPDYYAVFSSLAEAHMHDIWQDRAAALACAEQVPVGQRSAAVQRFMERLGRADEMHEQQQQVRQQIEQLCNDDTRPTEQRAAGLHALGRQLLQGSYPSLAVHAILAASDLCPQDGELHHEAARVCVRLSRYAQAISHCKAAVQACPDNADYYYHGATVMEHHRQLPDALDFALRAVELQPHNRDYRLLLERINGRAQQSIDAERYSDFRERVATVLGETG